MAASPKDIKNRAQGDRVKTYLKAVNTVLNPGGAALDYGIDKVGSSDIGSAALDLTPLIGGYKQMREARDGQTTTGKTLKGKERLVHGAVGLGSLLLDASGAGEMEKGARIAGKSTGLIKGLGEGLAKRGATKSANLVGKSAQFMTKNPELVRVAENAAENHLDDAIKYVRTSSRSDARNKLKKEASNFMPAPLASGLVDAAEAKLDTDVAGLRDRAESPTPKGPTTPKPSEPPTLPGSTQDDNARKAQLRAARRRMAPISPTRFELGRKNAGIPTPGIPRKRSTGSTQKFGTGKDRANNLNDIGELESKRRGALMASRLQGAMGQRWQAEASRQAVQDDAPQFGADAKGQDPVEKLKQGRMLAMVERAIAKQMADKANAPDEKEQEENNKMQQALKKKAKAAFTRGAVYIVDLLAAALDMSSSGISFVVDIFVYLFSLGWLNLEMIYGKHFAKGKSRYISPISWDPIPMPVDKDAVFLQSFVIAADIALAIAILMMTFGGFCFLHDYVKFVSSPLQVGVALAQGGDGMCLGAILSTMFGL